MSLVTSLSWEKLRYHTHCVNMKPTIDSAAPLARRLDGCDRVIQNEASDPNEGNVCLFSAAGAPGRTVLRTDGVLLGKYDIINR